MTAMEASIVEDPSIEPCASSTPIPKSPQDGSDNEAGEPDGQETSGRCESQGDPTETGSACEQSPDGKDSNDHPEPQKEQEQLPSQLGLVESKTGPATEEPVVSAGTKGSGSKPIGSEDRLTPSVGKPKTEATTELLPATAVDQERRSDRDLFLSESPGSQCSPTPPLIAPGQGDPPAMAEPRGTPSPPIRTALRGP